MSSSIRVHHNCGQLWWTRIEPDQIKPVAGGWTDVGQKFVEFEGVLHDGSMGISRDLFSKTVKGVYTLYHTTTHGSYMYFVSIRCDTACSGGTITANFPTFKFNIDPADDKTGLRGWDCCVQLAEIALFDGAGTAIPGSAASNTVGLEPLIAGDYCDDFGNPQNPGQHPCGELPFDAVDGNIKNSNTGNTNHKWLDFTRGDLVISFSSSVSVASYDWRTANDAPNRDPVKWVLEGSHGSDVWVAVDDTYASAMFNPTEERFKWQGPFPIKNGGGLSYGWDCQGNATVDYSGGRRGLDRDNGLGINHFDRDGTCPGKVNWQIAVPNGAYTVTVDFGEDAWTHGCEVEGNIGDACPRPTAPCYHRQ